MALFSFIFGFCCRKSFCAYAHIDNELNVTSNVGREDNALSHSKGLLSAAFRLALTFLTPLPHLASEAEQYLHSIHLPVWLFSAGQCTQDWCSWSMVSMKAVRNQIVPQCVEWRVETDNQATADETDTKKPLENCRKPPGRPHTTWIRLSNNLSLNEAINMAQTHPLWRLMS